MKRGLMFFALAVALVGCADRNTGIEINEDEAIDIAMYKSEELARAVVEAKSVEEFIEARAELEAYEEAMRKQIGGEEYEMFMDTANQILSNI
jgi:flavin-dependent dehydrogenase